jgi:hypothetical protein
LNRLLACGKIVDPERGYNLFLYADPLNISHLVDIANFLSRLWLSLCFKAEVVELVDTPDLGSGAAMCGGSSPPFRTILCNLI